MMLTRAGSRAGLRGILPARPLAAWAAALARRPVTVAKRGRDLTTEIIDIVAGHGPPLPRDRRFNDRAWTENGAYRRWAQTHLAIHSTARLLLQDAELDERTESMLRLLIDNAASAASPSNTLLNPAAVKEAFDTGGVSLWRGLRNLLDDMSAAPRIPTMVDRSAFTVGEDVAATPGTVVQRHEMYELIEYTPTTPQVRATPLLMVPPMINKYYALDLAPGRSVVEHLVGAGHRVFVISWRNPTAQHASWGLDAYVGAVLAAVGAVLDVTRSPRTSLWGTCSGGIIAAVTAAHLASRGQDLVASLALTVTLLDQDVQGATGALLDPDQARRAIRRSARRGFLDGASLAELFAWLRPDDLVWNYWVSNYLMGRQPPAFDLLFWNADSTRLTAALHRDFIDLAIHNRLLNPGSLTVRDGPVDLGDIEVDSFVVAGKADHITPWRTCYRSTRMLGGRCEFVLSNSGHVAAMVNPPGNPRAEFQHGTSTPEDPEEFLAQATTVSGSWWPAYVEWLDSRSGDLVPAPSQPGSDAYPPLHPAPGTYVHAT
ncbi:PHA/PHB synthase family protein [Nocardioides sp.]